VATNEEIGTVLDHLGTYFHREKPTPDRLKLYLEHLADLHMGALWAAADHAIRDCEFFPSVRQLRIFAADEQEKMLARERNLKMLEAGTRWRSHAAESADPNDPRVVAARNYLRMKFPIMRPERIEEEGDRDAGTVQHSAMASRDERQAAGSEEGGSDDDRSRGDCSTA
jgi:hypothetical protein